MSYVYVIAHKTEHGPAAPVKVGVSHFPMSRLLSLQTGNPNRIEIVWSFNLPTRDLAVMVEQESHAVLNQYIIKGEWFDCEPEWAVYIVSSVLRMTLEETYEDQDGFLLHLQKSGHPTCVEWLRGKGIIK